MSWREDTRRHSAAKQRIGVCIRLLCKPLDASNEKHDVRKLIIETLICARSGVRPVK